MVQAVAGSSPVAHPRKPGVAITSKPSYLAVVPAYNEADTVVDVVRSIRVRAPAFDVVVIDDWSTDETRRQAVAAGARVLHLPFNLG
ncbi:MAG: hypothetical protein QOI65_467, partial [Thermoleophilaceae bacterium]|nr:hypothetical protein [Thermoleophilaceae bacterium]